MLSKVLLMIVVRLRERRIPECVLLPDAIEQAVIEDAEAAADDVLPWPKRS